MTEQYLYQVLLYSIFALTPLIFLILLFISAPYGRHHRSGWGIVMNNRLAWFWMELPAIVTILIWFVLSDQKNATTTLFISLWQAHYVYRTFIFPARIKGSNKSFPMSLILSAVVFNVINGTINGLYLFHLSEHYDSSWLLRPATISGLLLFITGFIIHYQSDSIILNLRQEQPTGYGIPQGKLFNYVTNPHYLGEVIQWTGWAILTWSVAGLSFAIFTLANLLPRAIANHRWYKKQFDNYPKRKIFIPFLF